MKVSKHTLIAEAKRVTPSWDRFDYEPATPESIVIRSTRESLTPLLKYGFKLKQTDNHWIAYKGEIKYKRGTYRAYKEELLEINKHKHGEDMYFIRRNPHEKWNYMKEIRAQMCGMFHGLQQTELDKAFRGDQSRMHYLHACNWSNPESVFDLMKRKGLNEFYWCDHRGIPYVLDVPTAEQILLEVAA